MSNFITNTTISASTLMRRVEIVLSLGGGCPINHPTDLSAFDFDGGVQEIVSSPSNELSLALPWAHYRAEEDKNTLYTSREALQPL